MPRKIFCKEAFSMSSNDEDEVFEGATRNSGDAKIDDAVVDNTEKKVWCKFYFSHIVECECEYRR